MDKDDVTEFVKDVKVRLNKIKSCTSESATSLPSRENHKFDTYGSSPLDINYEKGLYASTDVGLGLQQSMAKPAVKPSIYDGCTPWQDYLAHFEIVCELNGWHDNNSRAMYLATCLRGPALGVLGDLDFESRYDYEIIINALKKRFCSDGNVELNRTLLKNRIRKPSETLPELAQNLKRLARNAYPDAPLSIQDSLAKDQFLDAMNDSEMQWYIFQSRPQNIGPSTSGCHRI